MKARSYVFALSLVLFCWTRAQAQGTPPDSLTENYLLDFSVPDMPAFKALGTEPSDLLRPSDIQKFAAMVSPFYSNGKSVFPKNFALEAAPWKLASKNMTLSQYRGIMRTLYNTGFSLGTVRDSSTNASKISLGMRVSILSKDKDILIAGPKLIAARQRQFGVLQVQLELAIRGEASYQEASGIDSIIKRLNANDTAGLTSATKDAWRAVTSVIGSDIPDSLATSTRLLSRFRRTVALPVFDSLVDAWKQNLWNSTRYDLGLAYVGESPDSLVSTSQYSSFQFWGAGAWRAGQYGQVLLGATLKIPRSEDSFRVDATLNLRGYLGTRDFRGFLEVQGKYKNTDTLNKSVLLNLGAEFRLAHHFWVTATGGINNYLGEPDPLNALVSSIDIRYGFNRKSNGLR